MTMEEKKNVIIIITTLMGGLEGCKGSCETLKNKLILTEFLVSPSLTLLLARRIVEIGASTG